MKKILSFCAVSFPVLFTWGCGSDSTGACAAEYPAAPAGASGVLHVSAACPADGADGSADHPYATLAAAIGKASKGATVLVADGTYKENLHLTKDVIIVGSSGGTRGEEVGIILQAPDPTAVDIAAGAVVTLQGFHIDKPKVVGVWARGGTANVVASRIEGTTSDANGFGVGVVSSDDGAIILQNSAITASASYGALLSGGTGSFTDNTISNNAAGGIRLDAASADVDITKNTLQGNKGFGVGVFSSRAIILQNVIKDTGLATFGDGILAGGIADAHGALSDSHVTAKDNEVSGSSRVGILCGGGTRGIILQNNVVAGSGTEAPFGAGMWLQAGAGGEAANSIEDNEVTASKFAGIGMTGETHGIILQNNAVTGTKLGTVFVGVDSMEIGDGVSLFKGASAKITGKNRLTGNGRFGLILDTAKGGSATEISGNIISENDNYGIILQNQANLPSIANNTFGGNGATGNENQDEVDKGTHGINNDDFPSEGIAAGL